MMLLHSKAAGGVWSLQPFFSEHVCYIYPLPGDSPTDQEGFDQAIDDIWCTCDIMGFLMLLEDTCHLPLDAHDFSVCRLEGAFLFFKQTSTGSLFLYVCTGSSSMYV